MPGGAPGARNRGRALQSAPAGHTMAAGKEAVVRSKPGWIGAAVLALALPCAAAAQERPRATYVQGGLAVSRQDGAADGETQLYIAAPGGTAVGWFVGGGVFVTAHVSVEGDWSWSGIMTAREPSRYGRTYGEERRDRQIGAMLRIHTRPAGSVDVEPVAGVAAVAHDRWSATEANRPWLPPDQAVDVGPRIRYETVTGAAFIAGADVRVGRGRVVLVPGFRIRAVTRGEDLVAYYPGGYPRWTVGAGVGARVVF